MEELTHCPERPEEQSAVSVQNDSNAEVTVCDIRFRNNTKTYYFDPDVFTLNAGDHVIIDTSRGDEFGFCAAGNHTVPASEIVPPLRKVLRIATAQDERVNQENQEREKKAYDVCLQKIADHGLDMQLVSCECAFDGSKILFFFTADGRVDFRELVKDLASVFRTRIELRQIGVRDKAKMVGGLGACGRPFCCKEFLDDFQPVSIKMAKTQNLSLNPAKISGTCGRLMCCLKYEQDAYEDLIKTAPKMESFVDTPDGRGTVTEINLLRQSVKVRMEDHPETISCYKNCDICVLRSGKARKNDPPIPKDLAPISSRPKAEPKPNIMEFDSLPEVIYNDEVAVIGEPEAYYEPEEAEAGVGQSGEASTEEAPGAAEKSEKAGSHRRHRRGRGKGQSTHSGEATKPAGNAENAQNARQDKPKTDARPKAERSHPEHTRKAQDASAPKPQSEKKTEGTQPAKTGSSHRRRYRGKRPSGSKGDAPKS